MVLLFLTGCLWFQSLNYAPSLGSMGGGIVSSDCEINPTFCNANQVFFKYCDGNSFSGARDGPLQLPVGGNSTVTASSNRSYSLHRNASEIDPSAEVDELFFRGTAIIEATLRRLQSDYGLAQAEDVLLTGCSAGGLAAFLQADRIGLFSRHFSSLLGRHFQATFQGTFVSFFGAKSFGNLTFGWSVLAQVTFWRPTLPLRRGTKSLRSPDSFWSRTTCSERASISSRSRASLSFQTPLRA